MTVPSAFPKPGFSLGEKVCWMVTLLGSAMVAVPICFEEQVRNWQGGQYALGFVGLLSALTAFISTFLFRRRRLVRDRLADEASLLVHWIYEREEWRRFTEEDFLRERRMKWGLFKVLVGICVVVGGAFLVFGERRGGLAVAGVLAALCVFIALLILVTSRTQRRRRLERGGEVRIGADGLWMSGELHVWKGWGARWEHCDLVAGQPRSLAFTYSMPARHRRQKVTVRVPIPTGFEAEAEGVVERFRALASRR